VAELLVPGGTAVPLRVGLGERSMMYALREERGQMAVELAALMPVILVSLVILWNLARYVSACVLFDRVAPDAVLAEAAAAGAEDGERGSSFSGGGVHTQGV
jgi:Flp pilus assembly protein TadG